MAIGWVKLSPSSCHEVITSQALSSKLALRPVAAGKSMHKFGDFENVTGCEGRLDCVMQSVCVCVCVCVCVRVSVFREYRLRLCGVWRAWLPISQPVSPVQSGADEDVTGRAYQTFVQVATQQSDKDELAKACAQVIPLVLTGSAYKTRKRVSMQQGQTRRSTSYQLTGKV